MARWTASAEWAAGPALDGRRDMPLGLGLNEGLGRAGDAPTVLLNITLLLVAAIPSLGECHELFEKHGFDR